MPWMATNALGVETIRQYAHMMPSPSTICPRIAAVYQGTSCANISHLRHRQAFPIHGWVSRHHEKTDPRHRTARLEKPIPSSLIKNAAPHDVREGKAWSSMQRSYGGGQMHAAICQSRLPDERSIGNHLHHFAHTRQTLSRHGIGKQAGIPESRCAGEQN